MSVPDDEIRHQQSVSGPTQPATGNSRRGLFATAGAGAAIAVIALVGAIALVWHPWHRQGNTPTATSSTAPVAGPYRSVAAPNPALANNPVVTASAPSVVKVRSLAPSCQKVLEGSGFVVAGNRVITNAHVVAASNAVDVYASGNPLDAVVVSYDPSVDIAIIAVPNLPAPPLAFAETPLKSDADALVLGYPGAGNFAATPVRIREHFKLSGPDIYRDPTPVTRDVYTVRANVDQGDSGGPLIDLNGQVQGVVFGTDVDDPDTGFMLTADEVASQLANIGNTAQVGTGGCVS